MAQEWSQHFSHYKSMGIFSDTQGQLTKQSQVWSCWISNQSKILLLQDEEDPIKAKALETGHNIIHWFFRHSRTANSVLGDWIWSKFKLIQALMVVLVTCKNEGNISPIIIAYGKFSRHSRAANSAVLGCILLNFEPIQDFMVVLVTCKNEEDLIKH